MEKNDPCIFAIRSGGQTGADRGALDTARAAGIPIRGWCPKGGWAEDANTPPGLLIPYPELAETPSADPLQRTEWNVRDSTATLIICPGGLDCSPGTAATAKFAEKYQRPILAVADSGDGTITRVCQWLEDIGDEIELNVAGPRASECAEAYEYSFELVGAVLRKYHSHLSEDNDPEVKADTGIPLQTVGGQCTFETLPESSYEPIVNADERELLIGLAERLTDAHFFNGSCARLESININVPIPSVMLSTIDFFDFAAINVVLENENRVLASATPEEKRVLQKVVAIRSALTESSSLADLLATKELPNVLALSCLMHDNNDRCFLARRKDSGIGAGYISCSVTGTIEACDLASANPVFACAQRECQEELGFSPPLDTLQLVGFAFDTRKMQPAALVTALVDNVEVIARRITMANDFGKENAGFEMCTATQALEDNTIEPILTNIAKIHLRSSSFPAYTVN